MKATRMRVDYDERPERTIVAYRIDPFGCLNGQREVIGERHINGDVVYTLKAHETVEEPPIVGDGFVPVFLDRTRTWVVVADHRGETWFDWNDKPQLIGRPGNPAEWGLRREPRYGATGT